MTASFDSGYGAEPFATLCANYPDSTIYPSVDFRTEWGPIFHRGRLDGTAQLLVIGQDPAAQESIARRILVGAAGHRVQGLIAKLGLTRSYVMINTFLYSVYGQGGGERHRSDAAIATYRNKWLDALLIGSNVKAVLALGSLADSAWQAYRATTGGKALSLAYQHVTHPTQPDSASKGNPTKRADLTKAMLAGWNGAITTLRPSITSPDSAAVGPLYGSAFKPSELREIPEFDLPAGYPAWMRNNEGWATRTGTGIAKRRTITVTIPK